MYESTINTCILCLSISTKKDIPSTTHSSDSPDIPSQPSLLFRLWLHTLRLCFHPGFQDPATQVLSE